MSTQGTAPDTQTPESSYWAVIPAPIRYDDQIPANAKLLYAEISSLTYNTGYCWADNEYFGRLFQWTERTIRRLLTDLKDAGYIRIEEERGQRNALIQRRIYAGLNPLAGANFSSDKIVQTDSVRTKLSASLDKNVQTHIIKEQEILNIPPIPPKGCARAKKMQNQSAKKAPDWMPDRFTKLRAYYPKGYAKNLQREIRAWDKLHLSSEEVDSMAAALKVMKQDPEWARGIGIPHLSTFLNERRWEDVDAFDVQQNVSEPDTERKLVGEAW